MCLWTRLECKWGHMCCMHFSCGNMIEFGLATQVTSYGREMARPASAGAKTLGRTEADWRWWKVNLAESMNFSYRDTDEILGYSVCTSSMFILERHKPPVPQYQPLQTSCICPGWEGQVLNPCLSLEGLKLPVEGWLVVLCRCTLHIPLVIPIGFSTSFIGGLRPSSCEPLLSSGTLSQSENCLPRMRSGGRFWCQKWSCWNKKIRWVHAPQFLMEHFVVKSFSWTTLHFEV